MRSLRDDEIQAADALSRDFEAVVYRRQPDSIGTGLTHDFDVLLGDTTHALEATMCTDPKARALANVLGEGIQESNCSRNWMVWLKPSAHEGCP